MNDEPIRPLFQQETITFIPTNTRTNISKIKAIKDPLSVIPNGIFKVINWEIKRLMAMLIIFLFILLASVVFILVYVFKLKPNWSAYIIPGIFVIFALYMSFNYIFSLKYTKISINKYRQEIKNGVSYTPVFIQKMYKNLYLNQVKHNWFTIFVIFYIGIFTLLLWWLKDVNWWIFNFKALVLMMFANPDMMVWIFTIILISTIAFQLVFMIQRKKKILEIDAYFGEQIESIKHIEELKASSNKSWRILFIWSILIILIIPALIILLLKAFKKRV